MDQKPKEFLIRADTKFIALIATDDEESAKIMFETLSKEIVERINLENVDKNIRLEQVSYQHITELPERN